MSSLTSRAAGGRDRPHVSEQVAQGRVVVAGGRVAWSLFRWGDLLIQPDELGGGLLPGLAGFGLGLLPDLLVGGSPLLLGGLGGAGGRPERFGAGLAAGHDLHAAPGRRVRLSLQGVLDLGQRDGQDSGDVAGLADGDSQRRAGAARPGARTRRTPTRPSLASYRPGAAGKLAGTPFSAVVTSVRAGT